MKKLLKDVKVYGGVKDKVEGCTHPVQHGDEFSISPSVRVKCIETPWCARPSLFLHTAPSLIK
jgi:hydroxyacylglutathione hydrolase